MATVEVQHIPKDDTGYISLVFDFLLVGDGVYECPDSRENTRDVSDR